MKYFKQYLLTAILTGLGIFSLAGQAATVSSATVSFVVNDNNILENELFNVDVKVSGIDPLNPLIGFGFDVLSSPTWSIEGATLGAGFFEPSLTFSDVVGAAFPPVSGDNILLATLDLRAQAWGTFDFGVLFNTAQADGGLFFQNTPDESLSSFQTITINPAVGQVPEPSPFTLLLISVVSFSVIRIKRRASSISSVN